MQDGNNGSVPAFEHGEEVWLLAVHAAMGGEGHQATLTMALRHAEYVMLHLCQSQLPGATEAAAALAAADHLDDVAAYLGKLAAYTAELGVAVRAQLGPEEIG